MKKNLLWGVKKIANGAGYDIKYYHPYYETLLATHKIKTVIDVGANVGQYALALHKILPKAHIYSFEPLKESFAMLKKNLAHVENFKAFNFALGEKNEKTIIHKSAFSPSSSLLSMAKLHQNLYPKSKDATSEEIQVKRLDDVSHEWTIKRPLLLKMDVQGFEEKVILGGKETLKKAKLAIIETSFVELYERQPLFAEIHTLMHSLGFSYHGHTEQHWNKKTGEPIYEDSVFINDSI